MTKSKSEYLSTVTFLATALVVLCHTDDALPPEMKTRFVSWLGSRFSAADVSNFFFLSGLLLARHYGEEGWWGSALLKRVRTLLVPYLAWCVIYWVYRIVMGLIALAFGTNVLLREVLLQPDLGISHAFGFGLLLQPWCFPMWYIKCLFYFILVSPLLFAILKHSRINVLMVVGLCVCVNAVASGYDWFFAPVFGFGFNLIGFAVYAIGAHLAIHGIDISRRKPVWVGVMALGAWVAVTWFSPFVCVYAGLPRVFNIAVGVVGLHLLVAALPWRVPQAIASTSFFVFAIHAMMLGVVKDAYMYLPIPRCCPELTMLLIFAVTVCIGIALARICNKTMPRLSGVLSGGRASRRF